MTVQNLKLGLALCGSKQSLECVYGCCRQETEEKHQSSPDDHNFIRKIASTYCRKNERHQDVVRSQAKSSSNPRINEDTREKNSRKHGDERRHYQESLIDFTQPESYQRQREEVQ